MGEVPLEGSSDLTRDCVYRIAGPLDAVSILGEGGGAHGEALARGGCC